MNFFGHSVTAGWKRSEPLFALGSMLPDFATMTGQPTPRLESEVASAGIDFHHEVDRVFHRHATVVWWMRRAAQDLDSAGFDRGPARGAAHVGVELLIDGFLVKSSPRCAAYLDALDAASHIEPLADPASPYHLLFERLRDLGAPRAYADPEQVASRVIRALSRRPRLRIEAPDRALLGRELAAIRARMEDDVDGFLRDLRARLTR